MRNLIYISFIFLFSCSGSTYYRENCEIDKSGWSKTKPTEFKVHITKNKQPYNTYVIVRHNALYKYNNLWLFINISDPAGNKKTDTVECVLSEPGGKWYGSGLGDMKTLKLAYRQQVTFPDTGIYTFSIEQAMREEPLANIIDIGFSLETVSFK